MEMILRQFNIGEPTQYHDSFYQLHDLENLPVELLEFRQSIGEIIFLTGNRNKLQELNSSLTLKSIKLSSPEVKIDLPEIQESNILSIVQDKCQRAYETFIINSDHGQAGNLDNSDDGVGDGHGQAVVLVEDTCLNFQALGGMPGPYVKCE